MGLYKSQVPFTLSFYAFLFPWHFDVANSVSKRMLRLSMENRKQQPSPCLCPRKYCFNWDAEPEALRATIGWKPFDACMDSADNDHGHCGWKRSRCSRLSKNPGTSDLYEPHEIELEKSGLPWFYFIPTSESLVDELKPKYLQESREYWGADTG